jgi:hypothetical protein
MGQSGSMGTMILSGVTVLFDDQDAERLSSIRWWVVSQFEIAGGGRYFAETKMDRFLRSDPAM